MAGNPTRVQKSDSGNLKSFKSPQSTHWDVPLHHDQLQKLLLGFQPQDMDDRWFVYAEGPHHGHAVVRFHRSWTGDQIVELQVKVEKSEHGHTHARITGITWEGSEDVFRGASEDFAKETVKGLSKGLLHVELHSHKVESHGHKVDSHGHKVESHHAHK